MALIPAGAAGCYCNINNVDQSHVPTTDSANLWVEYGGCLPAHGNLTWLIRIAGQTERQNVVTHVGICSGQQSYFCEPFMVARGQEHKL